MTASSSPSLAFIANGHMHAAGGQVALFEVLELLVSLDLRPADLQEIGSNERRALMEMCGGIGEVPTDQLLGNPQVMRQYGLLTQGADDEPGLIHFDRLTEILQDRCGCQPGEQAFLFPLSLL